VLFEDEGKRGATSLRVAVAVVVVVVAVIVVELEKVDFIRH